MNLSKCLSLKDRGLKQVANSAMKVVCEVSLRDGDSESHFLKESDLASKLI